MSKKLRDRLETWLLTTVVAVLVWLYAEGEIVKTHGVELPVRFVAPPGQELVIDPDRATDAEGVMQVLVKVRASAGQMQDFRRRWDDQPIRIRVADPASAGQTQEFVLREAIALDGMPLNVVDTAGLREADTAAEREGVRRARAEIEAADRVLLVRDDRDQGESLEDLLPDAARSADAPVTVIRNKMDGSGGAAGMRGGEPPEVGVSALAGTGLDELTAHLKAVAGYEGPGGEVFSARRRHRDALRRAREHLRDGRIRLGEHGPGDLLAEELRLAQRALGEITGAVTSEDLLDRIFAEFCIGK